MNRLAARAGLVGAIASHHSKPQPGKLIPKLAFFKPAILRFSKHKRVSDFGDAQIRVQAMNLKKSLLVLPLVDAGRWG
ncbi:MAG: hypothetical protein HC899_04305 [Leptolyngbyaceae cyanobacterium SM1_4_3]|nr:hypothetical protein [Leptolyngbyaceae cyanobacterium SM1_4_3]NJN91794.1 hypothetical protein [Leptolyngbyaceae cyanobacterium SL_5_14]NJO67430.1 hypothetical protein [Leptolyngbyaceae cyanobacterium RM1_405_57]